MSIKTIFAVLSVSGASMLYGAATVQYELFPYPQIMQAKRTATYDERPPYYIDKKSFFDQHGKQFPIAMAGDSLTDHAEWGELLNTSAIANRGIGGDTSKGLLERMDSIYSTHANTTFLMIGINDIIKNQEVATIFDNYTKVLELLTANNMHPHIQSTLLVGKQKAQYNEHVHDLNARLVAYAAEKKIPFIDLNILLSKNDVLDESYTNDGIHLNSQGYALWAEAIRPYVTASLNSAQNN